jgi:hypothetical protein
MRYRENMPEDLKRACTAVAAWRGQHTQGTAEQLVQDLSGQFHRDYGVVLRAVPFSVDSHAAKITTGLSTVGALRRPGMRP